MKAVCIALLVLSMGVPLSLAREPAASQPSVADFLSIIKALQPSLVRVEFHLQYDKGEAPGARAMYGGYGSYSEYSELIVEERPLEDGGYVLSSNEVIVEDPMIHPRFIKKIDVCFGEQSVTAQPAAYGVAQNALILTLDRPLEGIKPLSFFPKAAPPYYQVFYHRQGADWTTDISSFQPEPSLTQAGRTYISTNGRLVVDAVGRPVGMNFVDELPTDDSWKGSPKDWSVISAADMRKALADLEKQFYQSVVRVSLGFRSPQKSSEEGDSYRYRFRVSEDENEGGTERNVLGIVLDAKRVLVLAKLSARVTARLERIELHPPSGEPVQAKFEGSLKDYGAFLATLESPLPENLQPVRFSTNDLRKYRNTLLWGVEARLQGEKCVAYFWPNRIVGFDLGWRRQVYPNVESEANAILYDRDGMILALPIIRRKPVAVRSDDDSYHEDRQVTAAKYLAAVIGDKDLARHLDPDNVPLTEEEENRLAWFGVEIQGLNSELARVNQISDLTMDGSFGALVSFVYPDSPAAKADIRVGDVLLRLIAEGQPKPIEIRVEEEMGFGEQPFPWDQLDEVPEPYLDQIPTPWPNAANFLSRTLSDLGFGKTFSLEFARGGKVLRKSCQVVQGPEYFGSAKKYKSEPVGLTVKNLTYEVRRYFRRKPTEPGVIVSKVEPGGKAFVSGVRPYEIITHVNDQPVRGVEDFERLTREGDKLVFSVKRMNKGRIVRIRNHVPATQPASRPAGGSDVRIKRPVGSGV